MEKQMDKQFLKGKIHLIGIFLLPPSLLGIIFIPNLVIKLSLGIFLLFLIYLILKIILKSDRF
ncbi:MAG: hypothetical protein COS42_06850 [Flavobacteriales bacterium CG03_land_8_20_14_0_80_35_15]|nr:MAG: hypothetical protein AUJ53_08190 [Flavobacteriaceae bacterium CG1_02_35_72]PIR12441.1 MAG: hypothetical protein COV50_09045 [Flavobacteriales bacterium CG11_big_fil_rev_8_21_14_0_20_35_7]PIV17051.1 MAG: hypothetical protein COS42_06850 [Flavobacteriales bacterium CG03_land_8_20_14_0_80_35_15]PIX05684.1 MAG: hypothetical protein COZ76_12840 [Flavobacteriales bacterium CG_4_8_14_3_um_filter_35_10]PJA05358.1 MAG: hypothetical protein COX71_07190 [Flavobacteriales bacterium CG_4_10_14_0_2_u